MGLVGLMNVLVTCCVTKSPDDLVFVSAQVVDYYSQAELPSPSAIGFVGILSSSEIARHRLVDPREEKPHLLLLKVEVGTRENLLEFASRRSFSLRSLVSICNGGEALHDISFSYVFFQGVLLDPGFSFPIPSQHESPLKYYLYVPLRREIVSSGTRQDPYDLQERPEDLCISLVGKNEWGARFASNEIKVTRGLISEALKRYSGAAD